ncbi:MAG: hypothetical protein KY455_06085 [Euryarchaeota archaeon]|nr:hypothetical protein [Euryarchaeota archaeon]
MPSGRSTPPDDARHALLSRAHAVSQTDLLAYTRSGSTMRERLPTIPTGRYSVGEVEVRSALTRCRLPGEPWSLNPYTGCSHDCVYCYVPDVAHVERPKWGSYAIVKRNLPTVLARELKQKQRREVFLSSATDPYQPVEGTYHPTGLCVS